MEEVFGLIIQAWLVVALIGGCVVVAAFWIGLLDAGYQEIKKGREKRRGASNARE